MKAGEGMTFVLRMITALVLMFSLTAALPAASVQADTVRVLPISGDIDGSQVAFIQRGLRQAEEKGDTAVVIPINTLGGRVDSALKIRDMIMASDVPVIAYITSRAWSAGALIALSSRHIIMAPGSSIGAAEPIPDTEKNIAALKAEFSATAAQTGHNPGVAEAMVDKTKGYPGYADPGKILALSDSQAKELNVSDGSADTLSDALALYSLGDAQTIYVDKDWRDDMIGILQNPYVRTLFVALIIAALLAEIKMAGIGAGIATAFVFGGLLLYSGNEPLVADLKIIAAFLVSLLCIGLELASPGIGIFGLAGVVLLFGSLFFMLGATYESIYILAGGTVLALIVFYFLGRHLPKSSLFDKLTLKNRSTKEKGYTSQEDYSRYLYERGTTITILRPSGTIRIGKERVDAVANGSFIDRDVTVRVISVEGGRIVVEPEPERHLKD